MTIAKESPALQSRQIFEGTIKDVSKGSFLATLRDKTNPNNPEEIVEFENSEVSSEDRGLVIPGSAFYWIIGRERTVAGQIKNVSTLQFRRAPTWSESSIAKATERAQGIIDLFGKGDDEVDATETR